MQRLFGRESKRLIQCYHMVVVIRFSIYMIGIIILSSSQLNYDVVYIEHLKNGRPTWIQKPCKKAIIRGGGSSWLNQPPARRPAWILSAAQWAKLNLVNQEGKIEQRNVLYQSVLIRVLLSKVVGKADYLISSWQWQHWRISRMVSSNMAAVALKDQVSACC